MQNTVNAYFSGTREVTTRPLYRYDQGQLLVFPNIPLPLAYEVHFSNTENGNSITQIGGAEGVLIPDSLLATGEPVFAYVYLHNDITDSETVYKVKIPVINRPAITDYVPTPEQDDAIAQAIAALNAAVNQTSADVQTTAEYAESAQNSASEAVSAKTEAEEARDEARAAAERAHNNFATFEVNPETGILTAHYTPDNMELVFELSAAKHLEVIIP